MENNRKPRKPISSTFEGSNNLQKDQPIQFVSRYHVSETNCSNTD